MSLKSVLVAIGIATGSLTLIGCVSEGYYGSGYDGPYYVRGGYVGSGVYIGNGGYYRDYRRPPRYPGPGGYNRPKPPRPGSIAQPRPPRPGATPKPQPQRPEPNIRPQPPRPAPIAGQMDPNRHTVIPRKGFVDLSNRR